jgi:hypothetical protein
MKILNPPEERREGFELVAIAGEGSAPTMFQFRLRLWDKGVGSVFSMYSSDVVQTGTCVKDPD